MTARAGEVLSGASRCSGSIPGQAVVMAGAGSVHTFGCRAATGACVGRVSCRYMHSGKVRDSAVGCGANSRGLLVFTWNLQGLAPGVCVVLRASRYRGVHGGASQ